MNSFPLGMGFSACSTGEGWSWAAEILLHLHLKSICLISPVINSFSIKNPSEHLSFREALLPLVHSSEHFLALSYSQLHPTPVEPSGACTQSQDLSSKEPQQGLPRPTTEGSDNSEAWYTPFTPDAEGIPSSVPHCPLDIPAFPGYYKPVRLTVSGHPVASLFWDFRAKFILSTEELEPDNLLELNKGRTEISITFKSA